jgi:hypothetical protein
VGLKTAAGLFALSFTSISLQAAPMLRLVASTVGPVQLASAGATNNQTLEAYNAGDGSLSLTFASSASWVTAAAGAPRNCITVSPANTNSCIPIAFAINTAGLPQGLSSAMVTVSGASGTVDSPQTVVVLVRIGAIDTYAAPGGTRDVAFATSGYVNRGEQRRRQLPFQLSLFDSPAAAGRHGRRNVHRVGRFDRQQQRHRQSDDSGDHAGDRATHRRGRRLDHVQSTAGSGWPGDSPGTGCARADLPVRARHHAE